ncbi:hypothetical protein CALCODRAFT_540089 [Calocera cornea HHB12733]|uniref:Uncharacterized protein n=1 Tax=Calocera cornea HHB12733 TaxID=1353952 RepID=A0A165GMZ0_9BASI|nr:hypothetical protein CALCODRAFT_540089 [Calocera cornea HHB12733]
MSSSTTNYLLDIRCSTLLPFTSTLARLLKSTSVGVDGLNATPASCTYESSERSATLVDIRLRVKARMRRVQTEKHALQAVRRQTTESRLFTRQKYFRELHTTFALYDVQLSMRFGGRDVQVLIGSTVVQSSSSTSNAIKAQIRDVRRQLKLAKSTLKRAHRSLRKARKRLHKAERKCDRHPTILRYASIYRAASMVQTFEREVTEGEARVTWLASQLTAAESGVLPGLGANAYGGVGNVGLGNTGQFMNSFNGMAINVGNGGGGGGTSAGMMEGLGHALPAIATAAGTLASVIPT